MSKIARKNQLIFGSEAGFQEISQYGSLAASAPAFSTDPDVIQGLSNYLDGWFAAVLGQNSPAIEDMNALQYLFAYQLAYIFQAGVPEWNSAAIYYTGSVVQESGIHYMSRIDSNVNNNPSADGPSWTNWQIIGGGLMSTLGDTFYADAHGNLTVLPVSGAPDGAVLQLSSGIPSWGVGGIPIGGTIPYGSTIQPFGFLFCDGTSYAISSYITLWNYIGNNFGTSDGASTTGNTSIGFPTVTVASTTGMNIGDYFRGEVGGVLLFPDGTTISNIVGSVVTASANALANGTTATIQSGQHFNVPQMEGYEARGADNGTGNDPDAAARTALNPGGNTGTSPSVVGSYQVDSVGPVNVLVPTYDNRGVGNAFSGISGNGFTPFIANNVASGGLNQTNGRNVAFNWIIKT